jgi:UTP--glucose-1-phosphate uridylyltransferase
MRVKKAVIPVAGLGTRFLPSTLTIPKVMIPVVDKPSIHFCVEEAAAAGIDHVIFVTSKGQDSISAYFEKQPDLEIATSRRGNQELADSLQKISELADISVVTQNKQLGLGHAVLMAKNQVGHENFAVFLPDDLILGQSSTIHEMVNISQTNSPSMVIALKQVQLDMVSNYGIAKLGKTDEVLSEIKSLVEKPSQATSPSNFAVIGRYILNVEIFDALEKVSPGALGEIQLTDAIESLIGDIPCLGYEFPGLHFDVGVPLGMLKASVHLALRRPDLKEDFLKWLSAELSVQIQDKNN